MDFDWNADPYLIQFWQKDVCESVSQGWVNTSFVQKNPNLSEDCLKEKDKTYLENKKNMKLNAWENLYLWHFCTAYCIHVQPFIMSVRSTWSRANTNINKGMRTKPSFMPKLTRCSLRVLCCRALGRFRQKLHSGFFLAGRMIRARNANVCINA